MHIRSEKTAFTLMFVICLSLSACINSLGRNLGERNKDDPTEQNGPVTPNSDQKPGPDAEGDKNTTTPSLAMTCESTSFKSNPIHETFAKMNISIRLDCAALQLKNNDDAAYKALGIDKVLYELDYYKKQIEGLRIKPGIIWISNISRRLVKEQQWMIASSVPNAAGIFVRREDLLQYLNEKYNVNGRNFTIAFTKRPWRGYGQSQGLLVDETADVKTFDRSYYDAAVSKMFVQLDDYKDIVATVSFDVDAGSLSEDEYDSASRTVVVPLKQLDSFSYFMTEILRRQANLQTAIQPYKIKAVVSQMTGGAPYGQQYIDSGGTLVLENTPQIYERYLKNVGVGLDKLIKLSPELVAAMKKKGADTLNIDANYYSDPYGNRENFVKNGVFTVYLSYFDSKKISTGSDYWIPRSIDEDLLRKCLNHLSEKAISSDPKPCKSNFR